MTALRSEDVMAHMVRLVAQARRGELEAERKGELVEAWQYRGGRIGILQLATELWSARVAGQIRKAAAMAYEQTFGEPFDPVPPGERSETR